MRLLVDISRCSRKSITIHFTIVECYVLQIIKHKNNICHVAEYESTFGMEDERDGSDFFAFLDSLASFGIW
jgi:hypothetical protein